jgi:hypothetical protein
MAPTTTQYRYPVRGMQQENLQPVADVNWARMIAFQRAIDSIIGGVGPHASFEEGKRRYEQGYGLQVKESERQQQLLQLQQQQEARAAQQQRFEGTARAARMVTQNPEMEPLLQGMPAPSSRNLEQRQPSVGPPPRPRRPTGTSRRRREASRAGPIWNPPSHRSMGPWRLAGSAKRLATP